MSEICEFGSKPRMTPSFDTKIDVFLQELSTCQARLKEQSRRESERLGDEWIRMGSLRD